MKTALRLLLAPYRFSVDRLFRMGEIGGAHWFTDPNLLYRRRNRLTYTRDFSNAAWVKARASVTTDATTAPDGSSTADKLVEDATASNTHQLAQAYTIGAGTPVVMSVYAKASERTWVRLTANSAAGTDASAYFNLGAGAVGTVGGGSATITSVGNGWYRCSVAGTTSTANPTPLILMASGDGGQSYTGDGVSGLFLWGAQLEFFATTPTEYQDVPTTWPQAYLDAVGAENIFAWVDNAGTTPVTAVGDTIGLSLDRAYGGMRGANSWNPASVSLSGESSQVSIGVYRIYSSAGVLSFVSGGTTVVGRLYEVQFTIDSITTPGAGVTVGDSGATFTTTGRKTSVWLANLTFAFIKRTAAATDIQISNVSVREIPGTHLIQATGTARPTLSARVNLLLSTGSFAAAAWTRRGTATVGAAAPDGTGELLSGIGALGAGDVFQQQAAVTGAAYKPYVEIWPVSTSGTLVFCNPQGLPYGQWNINMTLLSTGQWNVITSSHPAVTVVNNYSGNASLAGVMFYASSGAPLSFYARRPDLRTADDASKNIPAYQRVGATAADHDTDGFPHYALFDGTDDSWASTATVDGSATDKVTVVTGVTKNSDAAAGCVVELTATSASNNGAFIASAPTSAAVYQWRSKGTVQSDAATAASYPAPNSAVLTGTGDIGADVSTLRIAGAQVASAATDQGTGNYSNATLYVGSRAGSSLRFNGRIYSLVFRFGAMSDADRNRLEQFTKNLMRLP